MLLLYHNQYSLRRFDNLLYSGSADSEISISTQPPYASYLRVTIKRNSTDLNTHVVGLIGEPSNELLVFNSTRDLYETKESSSVFTSLSSITTSLLTNEEISIRCYHPSGSPALITTTLTISGRMVQSVWKYSVAVDGWTPDRRNLLLSLNEIKPKDTIINGETEYQISSVRKLYHPSIDLWEGEINEIEPGDDDF